MGFVEATFLDKSERDFFYERRQVDLVLKSKNKPYTLSIEHLKEMYEVCHVVSIEEFAMNYCFGYFMLRPELDSIILREAMLIEILEYYQSQLLEKI